MCFIWTHGHVYCEASLSPSLYHLPTSFLIAGTSPLHYLHTFSYLTTVPCFSFSHIGTYANCISLSIYLSLNLSQSLKQAQVQEHLFSQRWDLFHTFVLMGYTPSNNNLFHIFFISIKLISA